MVEITIEELKNRQLEILSGIDKFCSENNIRYSLAFGSLLGAVRHKGYIPWDDDIDIMMLREDYDHFIAMYNDNESYILSFEKNPLYILPFAKVVDKNSILIEESTMKLPLGIYVDIFPVDNIPDNQEECDLFYKKKRLLNRIHDIKILSFSGKRAIWKNIILAVGKLLTLPISATRVTKMICSLAVKFDKQVCSRVAVFVPTDNKQRWIVDKTIFDKYKSISFEDKLYYSVEDTDSYLRATYGDYMKLPPEGERVTHHSCKVYIDCYEH